MIILVFGNRGKSVPLMKKPIASLYFCVLRQASRLGKRPLMWAWPE